MRMRESDQRETVVAVYDQDIEQKSMLPSNQRLNTMVKKFLDQQMRARNCEAMKGNWRYLSMEGKRKVYKGDACSFRHDESECGRFTRSTSPTPNPQTNNDGKGRQQSIWKKSPMTVQGLPQWKVYEPVV